MIKHVEESAKKTETIGVKVHPANIGRNGLGKCTLTKDICGTTDVTSDGLTDKVFIKATFPPDPAAFIESLGADLKTSDLCDIHERVR